MSATSGPNIVENGLVFQTDPANIKSYSFNPSTSDHGIADWYCFSSGTATYSAIYENTRIYSKDQNGNISQVLFLSSPQSGQFSTTTGYTYFADKAIFLSDENEQHYIVPLTAAGTKFVWYAARNVSPGRIFVYAPFAKTTINYFDNTANGINSSPTKTVQINKGEQHIDLYFTNTGYHFLSSDYPIVASIGGDNNVDNTPLNPAETVVYNRFSAYNRTVTNIDATNGTYVFYSSDPVMSHTIADGAGGNCAQGLGKSYISDRYSFGNVLSDYAIVCPNSNTITTSYWNGSQWVVWDTHNLSGTELSPVRVTRDGVNGPGVEASTLSGTATNMASGATLWKWEGTNKFFVGINDSFDDEISLYGWMSNNYERNISDNRNTVIDEIINISSIDGNILNGAQFTYDNYGSINFIGSSSQYIQFPNSSTINFLNTASYTLEAWVYPTINPGPNNWTGILDRESNVGAGRDGYNLYMNGSSIPETNVYFGCDRWFSGNGVFPFIAVPNSQALNRWQLITYTYDGSTVKLYRNATLGNSATSTGNILNSSKALTIGVRGGQYFTGKISSVKIYNRALSQSEITQNFNALRGRFGV